MEEQDSERGTAEKFENSAEKIHTLCLRHLLTDVIPQRLNKKTLVSIGEK